MEKAQSDLVQSELSARKEEPPRTSILQIQDLTVNYRIGKNRVHALNNISFELKEREFVAVVGESGSGKSTLAFAIIGLLPPRTEINGDLKFKDVQVSGFENKDWNELRGTEIGMIFQEPLSSLNPITKIGAQMWETLQRRNGQKRTEIKLYDYSPGKVTMTANHNPIGGAFRRTIPSTAQEEIIYWLKLVRIPDPESILEKYPFELSGGMIQRVMIAMVLCQRPSLLLADEPTTALDVTTQAQILKLFLNLRNLTNASVLLVTHDLGVAAQVADRVVVMYAGEIVEDGTKEQVFSHPLHPYTQALIRCFPRGHKSRGELGKIPGMVPVITADKIGCRFEDRCEFSSRKCRDANVRYVEVEPKHFVKCTSYY
jgi:oligopeptide/dipeptide ABC transporter ATP-binding protein